MFSIIISIRKTQIKTARGYRTVRMAEIKNANIPKCWLGCGAPEPSWITLGTQTVTP